MTAKVHMDFDTYKMLQQFTCPENSFEDESEMLGQFVVLLTTAIEGDYCGYLVLEEDALDYFTDPSVGKRLEAYLANEMFAQAAYAAASEQCVMIAEGQDLHGPPQPEDASPDTGSSYEFVASGGIMLAEQHVEQNRSCQNIRHFFVPTFHRENSNVVIWIQKEVSEPAQLNSIYDRLLDLSLLSQGKAKTQASASDDHEQKLVELTRQLEESRELTIDAKGLNVLSENISVALEKEKSAFRLANELKVFFKAERVSVVDIVGKSHRVIAASGQPVINRRANIVRSTAKMAKSIGLVDQPVFFEGDISKFPPSTHKAIRSFLNESMATSFAVLPILESKEKIYESEEQSLVEVVNPGRTHDRKVTGAVIVEQMTTPMVAEKLKQQWSLAKPVVENQHNNSKKYSELLFLPLQILLTKFVALYRGHTRRLAFAITAAILVPILIAAITPAPFLVRCEGVIRPKNLIAIFSPEDSIVKSVHVKEGQIVSKGELLAQLHDFSLERELGEAKGKLAMLHAKQTANQHQRIVFLPSQPRARKEKLAKLEMEGSDLQLQIDEASQMVKLLSRRAKALEIRAPFEGQIIGWNLDRKLVNRPVGAGVKMFSVAPVNADWVLELKVPDKRAGYIRTAFYEADSKELPAEFTIVTNPDTVHDAKLVHVNPGLEEDSDLGYVLPMEALPKDKLPENLRSGTPVIAKVRCGTESYLYCKSYEFINWIDRLVFEFIS